MVMLYGVRIWGRRACARKGEMARALSTRGHVRDGGRGPAHFFGAGARQRPIVCVAARTMEARLRAALSARQCATCHQGEVVRAQWGRGFRPGVFMCAEGVRDVRALL